MIDYDTFKHALVRICIIASDKMENDVSKTTTTSTAEKQQRVKEIINKRDQDRKALEK
jgi:hypothetical protein